jgi:hypothetical protein
MENPTATWNLLHDRFYRCVFMLLFAITKRFSTVSNLLIRVFLTSMHNYFSSGRRQELYQLNWQDVDLSMYIVAGAPYASPLGKCACDNSFTGGQAAVQ